MKQRDESTIEIAGQKIHTGPGTVAFTADSVKKPDLDQIKKAAQKASRIGAFEGVIDEDEWANTTTAR